jgi:hypothetical protein
MIYIVFNNDIFLSNSLTLNLNLYPNTFKIYIFIIIMSIDPAFPKNHKVIGKHKNEDGRFHFVGVAGRSNAESSSNDQVQGSYKTRGEEYVPL